MSNKLIVIEGSCDGIGKTTQFNLLKEHLINENNNVVTHHFPSYNTIQGSLVEEYLNGKYGHINEISPYFIASLYAVDRAVTWYSNLKKEYENNSVILLDRYTTSTLIYQSALIEDIEEKKRFIDFVIDYEYNKIGIKKPDIVLFLTAPFDLITNLRKNRKENDGISNDIHESDMSFMKKVYDNSLFVAKYLSWNIINCNDNDKMKSIEEIHKEIYKTIKESNKN